MQIKEGNLRFDKPLIAFPEVQPPAYRVPKPNRNPPTTMIIKPLRVRSFSQLNSSSGINLP